jgi:hypothetical protein
MRRRRKAALLFSRRQARPVSSRWRRRIVLRISIFGQRRGRNKREVIRHGYDVWIRTIRHRSGHAVDHRVVGPQRSVRHDTAIGEGHIAASAVRDDSRT